MNWLGDFVNFCLEGGYGGIALLALLALFALSLTYAALRGVAACGRAFIRGWRSGAPVEPPRGASSD